MIFKDKITGTLHNVTNDWLVPQYETNERFEKVVEVVAEIEKPKKTTKK